MNKIGTKKCRVCDREFKYNTVKGNYGVRGKGKRRRKESLTCSPKCSKIYNRISQFIYGRKIRKICPKTIVTKVFK